MGVPYWRAVWHQTHGRWYTSRMDDTKPLTPKRARFVEEYLKDSNGTQAAIRAGYSPKTAQEQAAFILSNVMVAQAVARGRELIAQKNDITVDRIVQGLQDIAYAPDPGPDTHPSRIVYPRDRNKALELLGRYKAMFVDRQEIKAAIGEDASLVYVAAHRC